MTDALRPTLGSYMSIECFRYLQMGAEDTAGRAVVVTAGKQRGHSLADILKGIEPDDVKMLTKTLVENLGLGGTRLCLVESIAKTATGYDVHVKESACCSGVKSEEAVCSYTLGVFIGVIEVVTGKRVLGQELECEAQGYEQCFYQLEII